MVVIRKSGPGDSKYAEVICALIQTSSDSNDLSKRDVSQIEKVIMEGLSALALDGENIIGFGYAKRWCDGFVSHSALVVSNEYRGKGIGKGLKGVLMEISSEKFPDSPIMSLTNSETVIKINTGLGFTPSPLSSLTTDKDFWEGCKGCRSFEEVNRKETGELNPVGSRCCCRGFVYDILLR